MSDGSTGRIRTEPMQSIGAQDLLSIGYTCYGFLRKKRRWDTLTGTSKWKQRFVVLSEGCLYCFNNESSAKPMAAFALCFYDSVHELFLKIPNCFEIKHQEPDRSSLIFSCESKERKRLWIEHLRDCIEQCGKMSASSINLSDQSVDEGIVADKVNERRNLPAPPVPQRPDLPSGQSPGVGSNKSRKFKETAQSEYDLESEEEDDDVDTEIYDDIIDDDDQFGGATAMTSAAKSKTLPGRVQVLPGLADLNINQRPVSMLSARPPVPLPVPSRTKSESSDEGGDLPDYENVFKSVDYVFDSNDRDQAKAHLQGRPDGTFLIRKSRSSASQVLSVVANRDVKEFQITEDGPKMSIDKVQFHPSLDSLLNFYFHNDLPKNDFKVKLKKGFKGK